MRRVLGSVLLVVFIGMYVGCKSERQMRLDRWGARIIDSAGVQFQHERNDCGVACVLMLLHAHGITADRKRIRSALALQSGGVDMLSIVKALEAERVAAQGIRCAPGYLGQIPLPAIVLIEDQHYMLLDSIRNDIGYFLRDPVLGRISVDKASFEEIWSGVVLVVELRKRMR